MGYNTLYLAETELQTHRDRVTRWHRDILDGTNQSVARQYYDEIQGLESKCAAAEIALNSCKFSTDEDETGLTDKLEEALADLRQAIEDFGDRLQGGNDRG